MIGSLVLVLIGSLVLVPSLQKQVKVIIILNYVKLLDNHPYIC